MMVLMYRFCVLKLLTIFTTCYTVLLFVFVQLLKLLLLFGLFTVMSIWRGSVLIHPVNVFVLSFIFVGVFCMCDFSVIFIWRCSVLMHPVNVFVLSFFFTGVFCICDFLFFFGSYNVTLYLKRSRQYAIVLVYVIMICFYYELQNTLNHKRQNHSIA